MQISDTAAIKIGLLALVMVSQSQYGKNAICHWYKINSKQNMVRNSRFLEAERVQFTLSDGQVEQYP